MSLNSAGVPTTETLIAAYAKSRDERLRTQIIERHENLVRSLAHKFARSGVPVEDLVQSAWIGLIGALDHFDPTNGAQFSTYAVNCGVGEIKRYFRDKTWALKVPRRLRELSGQLAGRESGIRREVPARRARPCLREGDILRGRDQRKPFTHQGAPAAGLAL